jgi:hypothetical protein
MAIDTREEFESSIGIALPVPSVPPGPTVGLTRGEMMQSAYCFPLFVSAETISLTAQARGTSRPYREVIEGMQWQGEDERVIYALDVSNVGSSPTSASVVVKNSYGKDVTSDVIPANSTTTSGNVITLPSLQNLISGVIYRVEVKYTINTGSVYENFFRVKGQE